MAAQIRRTLSSTTRMIFTRFAAKMRKTLNSSAKRSQPKLRQENARIETRKNKQAWSREAVAKAILVPRKSTALTVTEVRAHISVFRFVVKGVCSHGDHGCWILSLISSRIRPGLMI